MGNKKKRQEDEIMTEYFLDALAGKEIPLLPLDARWHELFPDFRKTREIKTLEKKLNKLIQKQGQTNNDLKEYEKAKKVLMKNIVNNMTDGHEVDSPIRSMKQDRNQKLLADLKEKKEQAEQVKQEIPGQIEAANRELLVDNTYEIEEIEEWVKATRERLKDEILRKQDMEMRNTQMYKYMHNLLGAEVVEIFDRKHQVWKGNMEENQFED